MYLLQVNLWNESEWKDVSYPPSDYITVSQRFDQYTSVWGKVHSYRIIQLP